MDFKRRISKERYAAAVVKAIVDKNMGFATDTSEALLDADEEKKAWEFQARVGIDTEFRLSEENLRLKSALDGVVHNKEYGFWVYQTKTKTWVDGDQFQYQRDLAKGLKYEKKLLMEALEHYADESNNHEIGDEKETISDKGAKARHALFRVRREP